MANQQPKSRPEPPAPSDPAIYGGQWGPGGKENAAETGQTDRPEPIDAPREPTGSPESDADDV